MGLKDTRMQAFKLPLIMDAPIGTAANGAAVAALDTLDDGVLPGADASPCSQPWCRQACRCFIIAFRFIPAQPSIHPVHDARRCRGNATGWRGCQRQQQQPGCYVAHEATQCASYGQWTCGSTCWWRCGAKWAAKAVAPKITAHKWQQSICSDAASSRPAAGSSQLRGVSLLLLAEGHVARYNLSTCCSYQHAPITTLAERRACPW